MPRKITKKSLRKKLDKAWSRIQLSKGKCEVCGQIETLNSHHIEGRRNLAMRWDPRNGVCLCSGCHTFRTNSAHQSPLWFHTWLEENRKEDIEHIEANRNQIVKWTIPALQEHLEELESILLNTNHGS